MSRHSRRSFVNETDTIKILPIIEAVGSDDEDDPWDEEKMEHPEDDDYHNEQELEASSRRKKPAKPPPLTLLKWQEENKKRVIRTEIYEELHAYEAQRRTTYNAKLEATKLYFKSLTDLLQNSFDETAKVYRLALGTSIAQSQYARAITQRATHQVPRDSSPTAALLHAWQEANTLLAATLEESAVDIEQNVVTVIASFQDALQEQKHQFENVGKPILQELEYMETQVQQTWDSYWRIANKTMDISSASISFSQTEEFESKQDDHVPVEDLWMVEMQYQMSVSLQRSTWEKRGPEIVRLAHSSKEMEVTRRIKLNESMVQFLQCLKKLFKTISEEDDSVKLPAAALLSPLESIHDDIEKKVMSHVEASLPKEFKLALPDDSAMGFGLESDALIMTARVLEWKNNYTPMSAADRWRTALAVVTMEGYLHLFDLEPFVRAEAERASEEDPKIYPGSDPFIAMDHIFPFFAKALKAKSAEEGYPLVTIRDKMVPERTLRLTKRCTFQQLSDECCELVQKTASKSLLLGGRQKPVYKAQLRILSSDAGSSDKDSFFALLQQTTKS